jgi:hypothetical protein
MNGREENCVQNCSGEIFREISLECIKFRFEDNINMNIGEIKYVDTSIV